MCKPLTPVELLTSEQNNYILQYNEWSYEQRQLENKANNFPQFVYRYLSSEISDDILKCYLLDSFLRLSSPTDFLDPFDMFAYVKIGKGSQLRERCTEIIKKSAPSLKWKEREKKVMEIMCNQEKLLSSTKHSFKKNIDNAGVLCFCEERQNLLMWSHYANQHEGLVLQFDTAHDIKTFLKINRVNYTDQLPTWNWSGNRLDDMTNVCMNKHKGWSYEKEWRMVIPDGARTYHQFRPEAISGLIFGCRTEDKFKNRVLNILQNRANSNLPPLNINCAVMHNKKYELKIEKDTSLNWPS